MAILAPSPLGVNDDLHKVGAAQAIPTDGNNDVSASSMDFSLAAPDVGKGARIDVLVKVTTAFTKSSATPTLDIRVISDGDAALGSPSVHGLAIEGMVGTTAAGKVYRGSIAANPVTPYERYIGVRLEPSGNELSAGNVDVYVGVGH
jgi:hypothetical protein